MADTPQLTNGFNGVGIGDVGGSAADYATGLNGGVNNAFSDYLKSVQGQTSPLDMYTQLENARGLPQLRQTQSTLQGTVNGLEDSLSRVKQNVTDTTNNSLATEAQRNGMVTAQSAPIQDNLTKQSTNLTRLGTQIANDESNVNQMVGYGVQGEQMQSDALKTGITVAQDNAARSMSGFTSDQQVKLNLLMEKIKRQDQMSDEEWQQASDLAKMEKQYQLELSNAQATKNPYMDVANKANLFNTSTGTYVPSIGGSGGDSAGFTVGSGSAWG